MKTNILLHIIIGLIFTSCSAQDDRIENKIMDCSYQSYSDGGTELKNLIIEYENLLVNEGILADNSGKSYRQVLQKIANGNEIDKVPSKFFGTEIQKIEKPNLEKVQECQKIILKDSASYDISKLKGIEEVVINAQNSNDLQPSLIAKDILKVLSDEDFEINFYKIRTFFLFGIFDTDLGLSSRLPETQENQTKYDLTNALKITLNDKSEIFVDNKKLTIDEFKKVVREYETKNKSESIISIKTDRETMYRTYIDVQNAITSEIRHLRENLAKEKYNTELDNLSEEELSEIKKIYPQIMAE